MMNLQIDRLSPILQVEGLDKTSCIHYLPEANFTEDTTERSVIKIVRRPMVEQNSNPLAQLMSDFPGNYYWRHEYPKQIFSASIKKSHNIRAHFETNESVYPYLIEIEENSSLNFSSFVLRAFREIQHQYLVSQGYILLHASACMDGEKVIAFTGDKGAGKSAWLLRCLQRGCAFLANDRVYLHLETLDVRPFPIAALISRPSLKNLPQDLIYAIETNQIQRRDHLIPGYNKVGLTPLELVQAFHVTLAASGQLNELHILSTHSLNDADISKTLDRNIYLPKDPTFTFGLFTRGKSELVNNEGLVRHLIKMKLVTPLYFSWTHFDQEQSYFLRQGVS